MVTNERNCAGRGIIDRNDRPLAADKYLLSFGSLGYNVFAPDDGNSVNYSNSNSPQKILRIMGTKVICTENGEEATVSNESPQKILRIMGTKVMCTETGEEATVLNESPQKILRIMGTKVICTETGEEATVLNESPQKILRIMGTKVMCTETGEEATVLNELPPEMLALKTSLNEEKAVAHQGSQLVVPRMCKTWKKRPVRDGIWRGNCPIAEEASMVKMPEEERCHISATNERQLTEAAPRDAGPVFVGPRDRGYDVFTIRSERQ
ncbi:uncharacterized protein LOC117222383 isoform X2 [Megalopta genalis]|uniref:uncharacterized protein LOC117222383 isoform X2 n=1 Tax=Megalopta genalis TaxID=115081 RepID=UPI003FD2C51E